MQPKPSSPRKVLFAFFVLVSMHTVAQQPAANTPKKIVPANAPADAYTFTILTSTNNCYGYDIAKNGVIVFHQPAEPATDKALTLKTIIQAQRAAMFVIHKMKYNIQPATLTTGELKKVTIN